MRNLPRSRKLNNIVADDDPAMLRFPTERVKPLLVVEKGHYYGHGEVTSNKQHCYCRWCDVFWPTGYNCYHFDEDRIPAHKRGRS